MAAPLPVVLVSRNTASRVVNVEKLLTGLESRVLSARQTPPEARVDVSNPLDDRQSEMPLPSRSAVVGLEVKVESQRLAMISGRFRSVVAESRVDAASAPVRSWTRTAVR